MVIDILSPLGAGLGLLLLLIVILVFLPRIFRI